MGGYNSRERTGLLVLAGAIVVVIAALFIARGCSRDSAGDVGNVAAKEMPGSGCSDVIVVDSLAGKRDSIENAEKAGRKVNKEKGKYKKKDRKKRSRSNKGSSSGSTVPYRDILGDTIPVADN